MLLLSTGNLALSRAFGDFNFKDNPNLEQEEQIVTGNGRHWFENASTTTITISPSHCPADPDIVAVDVTSDHEFVVLACDGKPITRL